MTGRITVAVVNHDTARDLETCLESLRAAGAEAVAVIDMASTDGSPRAGAPSFP